ncbi:hypothetical protein LISE100100_06950 [Listeria seeligeri]|uniref:Uncharacterized protein n=1 Tax=Listeria ivanovii TaxID=1638 RepID=A0AAX2DL98_LISIV|nr:hypothetical protein SAMN05421782_10141 [Listeria ivanovii]VEH48366.1 Uncharacterised protein [Listeria ivanovii subsp. londoniensis]
MAHRQEDELEEPDSYHEYQAARVTNLHLWQT